MDCRIPTLKIFSDSNSYEFGNVIKNGEECNQEVVSAIHAVMYIDWTCGFQMHFEDTVRIAE